MNQLGLWVGFNILVLILLALDLGVFHRKAHEVKLREATIWSIVWVIVALIFNAGIWRYMGHQAGLEFFTGYLIERALSIDNIFVFVLLFSYFRVPARYQHRVLFWGILGALVMRGGMIATGAWLVAKFHWILYIFGAFLVFTGIRMAYQKEADIEPEANPVLRFIRRHMPVTREYHADHFFVRQALKPGGPVRTVGTPLFVVLVLVETTDLIFAVDSIPAIFAVTTNAFIIYSSNVFAIFGLRAMYFLLAGIIDKFHYLKLGLSIVLVYVGIKMLLVDIWKIPIGLSLGVVVVVLAAAVGLSLLFPKAAEEQTPVEHLPLGDGNGAVAPIENSEPDAEVPETRR